MRTRHDVRPLAGAARFTALRRTRESSDIRRLDGARQGDESADARRLLANARFAYLAISLSMRPLLLSVTGACIDDKMPQSGRTNGYRSKSLALNSSESALSHNAFRTAKATMRFRPSANPFSRRASSASEASQKNCSSASRVIEQRTSRPPAKTGNKTVAPSDATTTSETLVVSIEDP
jgi:hypothetical protein